MKWRVLAKAAKDLAEIEAYISTDSRDAALSVASRLRKSFELVSTRPEIGRPTLVANIREWSVPGLPYLIPYRIQTDRVEIIRVWHTSRQRPTEW
jgi:toxin ParE1/3/4